MLAVKPVQLIGDEHPPVPLSLETDAVREAILGHHLDERPVAAARMPVPVLQPQRFPQPQPLSRSSVTRKRSWGRWQHAVIRSACSGVNLTGS